jgi:ATP-dependent RNA helicase DeaD
MKKLNFNELELSQEIHDAIKDMGFEEASPIQSEAIPYLLAGRDVIGQAQTGTGKTAAFGIPALELIDTESRKLQVVILCPTRELTIQVAEEFSKLAKYKKGISVLPIYGGQSIDRQIMGLKKKPQVIIGTPGRVIDHLNRHTLKMGDVKMFVLDEADEMLNMGFIEDIELILESIPAERQTVFFSATMPKPILELTKKYQKDPHFVKVVHQELTIPSTEQYYLEVKEKNKLEVLSRLIDVHNVKLGLIFCRTKMRVDELTEHLQTRGYSAEGLHGDMRQGQREQVMKKFRAGAVEILVATDVAARGLDVDDIEAVFNYDIPYDEESYVHRIGRTGRAGRAGKSFSFVVGKEIYKLRDIQKYAKTNIKHLMVPSINDVEEIKISSFLERVKTIIDDKDSNLDKYVKIAERLIDEEYTSLDIASALLKINLGLPEKGSGDIEDIRTNLMEDKKVGGKIARLFINVGRLDKVSPKDILGAIAGETGIKGSLIGSIDIYDKFTFVEIPVEYANEVMDIMNTKQIKGRSVNIEIAQAKPEGSDDRREGRGGSRRGSGRSERSDRPERAGFKADRPERAGVRTERPERPGIKPERSDRPERKKDFEPKAKKDKSESKAYAPKESGFKRLEKDFKNTGTGDNFPKKLPKKVDINGFAISSEKSSDKKKKRVKK